MLADANRFVGNLFFRGQHALGLAQLQIHRVSVGPLRDPLYDAAHHLAFMLENILEHLILLGISQPLEDDLLADLCGQPGKVLGRQRNIDHVAQGRLSQLACLLQADLRRRFLDLNHHAPAAKDRDLGGIRVDVHSDALRRIEGPPVGGGERHLHQGKQGLLGDPLLFLDLVHRLEKI